MRGNAAQRSARPGVVDPRLLRHASAARAFLVASVALGCVAVALILAQAWLLADVIARAFGAGQGLTALRVALCLLAAVVVGRAAVAWIAEAVAGRTCTQAKRQLREALLRRVADVGPNHPGQGSGAIAVLATRGLDALDAYFSLYLPQIPLSVIVPASVLVVVFSQDWISGLIIAITLPLIPVFMALVGATTAERTRAQLRVLQRLAGHFLDVVAGLPTLKVFGRVGHQIDVIDEVSERYRRTALSSLRITFLSSLILELVATISVALIAVAVGLRLLYGEIGLRPALVVLLLAPEAYLPLRQLGANYHAGAEGVSAAEQAFAMLEAPTPARGSRTDIPNPARTGIEVTDLTVRYPGRARAALQRVSLSVDPGEVVALTGRSGCGKSTLLDALLGFVAPDEGSVRIGDAELADLDPVAWRARVAWVPQRPHIFAASIEENIRLGRTDVSPHELSDAVAAAGLTDVVRARPNGLATMLGDGGLGLSAGERQRLALARAFLRDAPLLLLDEPTANLDGETEAAVLTAVQRLIERRTTLLVAHRPALVALADRLVSLDRVKVAA